MHQHVDIFDLTKFLFLYLHLAELTAEDQIDLLCKVCLLVTHLGQKFAKTSTPGKNITVDQGLVKFDGVLSIKQYMPMFAQTGKDYPTELKQI